MVIFQPKQYRGAGSGALHLLLGFCRWARAATPWGMTWSSESYGPDGPWNAVQVSIGSPGQTIALYPGSTWESKILLSYACDNTSLSSVCYADKAGVFDPEESTTWDNKSIQLPPTGFDWESYIPGHTNAVPTEVIARRALDSIDIGGGTVVPEVDLVGISQAYQTYPGGQEYPLQVGLLSLGALYINHTFDQVDDEPAINGTFITSWLWEESTIESYSYGLHIGSASLGIPGSLLLGGYDKNRALGDVSAQPFSGGNYPIQLLDIGLGVAGGGSPWNFLNKTGFLAKDNSSLETGITVQASTADPYLYLPQSSCDAIAAELPVVYQSDYGLYFWNTSDSRYSQIVTSPSYLAFTFSKNGLNNADITINVPFALLNLTLEPPLIDTPTPYFPCMGTDSTYALGRAFFQAAFIGVNWNQGVGNWFIAQAPGPGYSTTVDRTNIEASASTITGSGSSWEAGWTRYWIELPKSSNSNSNPSSNFNSSSSASPSPNGNEPDSGLSAGANAGIGVGCAVGAALVIALLVWFFFLRHRRQSDRALYPNGRGEQTAMVPPSFPTSVVNHFAKSDEVHEMAEDRSHQHEGPYELYER
ncbi:aspartic peptidase domain-containing protein [Aspergillus californicus]